MFCQCSGLCLLGFHAMSSGTVEGPQLRVNKAQKALSIWEWSAITYTQLAGDEASISGCKQVADLTPSRPARPHHRGLFDAVIHPIGEIDDEVGEVDSVSISGSLRGRRRPEQRD